MERQQYSVMHSTQVALSDLRGQRINKAPLRPTWGERLLHCNIARGKTCGV
jgi:hypothetical protein